MVIMGQSNQPIRQFKKNLEGSTMKKITLVVLAVFVLIACSTETFFYQISGGARLKDKKTVHYSMDIYVETAKGIVELKKKEKKIKHAMRIIIAQRSTKQLNNAARLKTIAKKVFISQLKCKVTSIKVNSFSLN